MVWGEVTRDVDVFDVVALLVRTCNKVCRRGNKFVNHNECTLRADRRCVAWHHPRRADLLLTRWSQVARTDRVGQLRLLNIVVAAHDRNDQPSIAIGEEDRLRGAFSSNAELLRECLDRWSVWRLHLLQRERRLTRRGRPTHASNLAV